MQGVRGLALVAERMTVDAVVVAARARVGGHEPGARWRLRAAALAVAALAGLLSLAVGPADALPPSIPAVTAGDLVDQAALDGTVAAGPVGGLVATTVAVFGIAAWETHDTWVPWVKSIWSVISHAGAAPVPQGAVQPPAAGQTVTCPDGNSCTGLWSSGWLQDSGVAAVQRWLVYEKSGGWYYVNGFQQTAYWDSGNDPSGTALCGAQVYVPSQSVVTTGNIQVSGSWQTAPVSYSWGSSSSAPGGVCGGGSAGWLFGGALKTSLNSNSGVSYNVPPTLTSLTASTDGCFKANYSQSYPAATCVSDQSYTTFDLMAGMAASYPASAQTAYVDTTCSNGTATQVLTATAAEADGGVHVVPCSSLGADWYPQKVDVGRSAGGITQSDGTEVFSGPTGTTRPVPGTAGSTVTGYDPTTGTSTTTDQTPQQGPSDASQPQACMDGAVGWNPVDWVMVPAECALKWAFVPTVTPASVSAPSLSAWSALVPSAVPASSCGTETVTLELPGAGGGPTTAGDVSGSLPDTCDGTWSTLASTSYSVSAIGCSIFALVFVVRQVGKET